MHVLRRFFLLRIVIGINKDKGEVHEMKHKSTEQGIKCNKTIILPICGRRTESETQRKAACSLVKLECRDLKSMEQRQSTNSCHIFMA